MYYLISNIIPYLFVRGLYGVAGGVALATYKLKNNSKEALLRFADAALQHISPDHD